LSMTRWLPSAAQPRAMPKVQRAAAKTRKRLGNLELE
jgi:hypothetical protein